MEKEINTPPSGDLGGFLQKTYTIKTAKAYQREIEIYQSNNPNHINYSYTQILNYIGLLRKKYQNPKTINRILSSIKAYHSYLCFTEIRTDNPAKSIVLKDPQSRDIQLQDLFNTEELEQLLTAKKERYPNLEARNKVLISLLIYQALRPTEMEALITQDIDLEKGTIYIKPSVKNNPRMLTLKPNQILLLHQYLNEARPHLLACSKVPPSEGFREAIIGQRGEPMTAEDITKHIKRNYNLYQPRTINPMTIRQSVITNLLTKNNDLRLVQAFAGHKNPSTTERYKQSNMEQLQAAINKHHPMA